MFKLINLIYDQLSFNNYKQLKISYIIISVKSSAKSLSLSSRILLRWVTKSQK